MVRILHLSTDFILFPHLNPSIWNAIADSSRRPSNESTCSLNVPFEREATPQVTTITVNKQTRSVSLVNIARFTKSSLSYDPDLALNGIEESPRSIHSEQAIRPVTRRMSLETTKVLVIPKIIILQKFWKLKRSKNPLFKPFVRAEVWTIKQQIIPGPEWKQDDVSK